MRLTQESIYQIEHQLIHDSLLWEMIGNDNECRAAAAYVCGINDMARAIANTIKKQENQNKQN